MISDLNRKDREFRIIAIAAIIGTAILSLFFLKDFVTPNNGVNLTKYSLPLSIVFFVQTCIVTLGLIKGLRSLVFLTISSYFLLIIIMVTFL